MEVSAKCQHEETTDLIKSFNGFINDILAIGFASLVVFVKV